MARERDFDVEAVVGKLNEILAMELATVVYYTHYAFMIYGHARIPIRSWFNDQASESLRTQDVVLGPAADGGYYLIGLKGAWQTNETRFKDLFCDVPWSTDQVLGITRRRIDSAGLTCSELETREDVDTIKELTSLRRSLELETERHTELKTGIERILGDISLPDPPSTEIS